VRRPTVLSVACLLGPDCFARWHNDATQMLVTDQAGKAQATHDVAARLLLISTGSMWFPRTTTASTSSPLPLVRQKYSLSVGWRGLTSSGMTVWSNRCPQSGRSYRGVKSALRSTCGVEV